MTPLTTIQAVDTRPEFVRPFLTDVPDLTRVNELRIQHTQEVIDFLNRRPVHTVVMTSFINDNGIESLLNRGKFYSYRNTTGTLEGVALIGHTTLVEARTDGAMKAFAFTARSSDTPLNLIMSAGEDARRFWTFFSNGLSPRLVCTELLFEVAFPFLVQDCKWEIRNAAADELEQVADAQAEVAFIESGIDPREKDRAGFLARVLRRIEQDRVFVVFENGKLLFKADIIAETNDVIYLEGIYVAPEYRGRGIGTNCLAKLNLRLLERVQNICLLSNVEHAAAHRSFTKAGFRNTDRYTTLFV